jgi:hypothetical protein
VSENIDTKLAKRRAAKRPAAGTKRPAVLLDDGITLVDLMSADLPEPRFLVAGVLPDGLSVLAARPKSGKSWFALQVAVAVSLGKPCLGGCETQPADVLYLALEDTRRRLKARAERILAATGWRPNQRLDLRVSWPRAGAGGLPLIAEWLEAHRGGLVIVDTLAKFRDPGDRGNAYHADYQAVADLKTLADQFEAAALAIHHTRKGAADDPFDEVSGTLGINGAADSIMVLDRNRGADSGAVYLTGRDISEQTFSLKWDAAGGLWSVASRGDGITRLEKPRPATKADQCAEWLVGFLGGFAWPDGEIIEEAGRVGFTDDNVKEAKARLRKADPPLKSKPAGKAGAWWNWIGTIRPPDRPARGADQAPETPESWNTTPQLCDIKGVQVSGGLCDGGPRV